jgi:hypothetical protein
MKKILKILLLFAIVTGFYSCDIIAEDEVFENVQIPDNNGTKKSRKAYLEYFTGHLCGNCPEKGSSQISNLKNFYGDKLIYLSVHTGFFARFSPAASKYFYDFKSSTGDALEQKYQIAQQGTPVGMVNRIFNANNRAFSPTDWAQKIQSVIEDSVDFEFVVEQKSSTAGTITIDYKIKTQSQMNGFETFSYLVEDSIINWQKDYQLTSQDVETYVHRFVLRDQLGSSSAFSLKAGEEKAFSFSGQNKAIYNTNQLYLYLFVAKDEEIIQVEKVKLVD